MSEERNKGEYLTGIYFGKEFVAKIEGKDGKEGFKSYKLQFKKSNDDQYTTKIGCADFVKGFDLLEEGEIFTVGYNLSEPKYNAKAKKDIQYKTAFFIKKEDSMPEEKPATKSVEKQEDFVLNEEEANNFAKEYLRRCVESKRTPSVEDGVRTFFNTLEPTIYATIKQAMVRELALPKSEESSSQE
jgi:hypothetical protein